MAIRLYSRNHEVSPDLNTPDYLFIFVDRFSYRIAQQEETPQNSKNIYVMFKGVIMTTLDLICKKLVYNLKFLFKVTRGKVKMLSSSRIF